MIRKIKSLLLSDEIISKGSSALFMKVFGGLFGYIFLLLVTRFSGAQTWGIFALCLAIISISSIISILGIDLSLVKFISTFKSRLSNIKHLYRQAIKIVCLVSICVAALLYFLSDFIAIHIFNKIYLAEYFRIASLAILPFSIININSQTLRGMKRITEFALYRHLLRYLFAIISFLIIIQYVDYNKQAAPVYAFLFSMLLLMLFSFTHVHRVIRNKDSVTHRIKNSELLRSSFPMMISASIVLTMSWADTIMIGIFLPGADQVGIYNGGLRVAMITGLLLEAINSIVAPKISETYNRGNLDEFRQVVKYSTRLIFITTIPVVLVLFIFPEFILSFLGSEFINAKYVLLILLIGKLVDSISGSVGVILQMTGHQKVFQNIVFIALILNILLNLLLIPIYGIEGAAISSTCSIIFWNISSVMYVRRKFGIWSFFTFST